MTELDSPWLPALSCLYVFAVTLFLTWAAYATFEIDKDAKMALYVTLAYAAQNVAKRIVRAKKTET